MTDLCHVTIFNRILLPSFCIVWNKLIIYLTIFDKGLPGGDYPNHFLLYFFSVFSLSYRFASLFIRFPSISFFASIFKFPSTAKNVRKYKFFASRKKIFFASVVVYFALKRDEWYILVNICNFLASTRGSKARLRKSKKYPIQINMYFLPVQNQI